MLTSTNETVVEGSVEPSTSDERQSGTLVIGIGNSLLTDDGAGIHVINRLSQRNLPEDVELLDGGTLGFTLLENIETTARLIVVDAAQLDAEPGTVKVLQNAEMDDYLGGSLRSSVHEVNLLDMMVAARLRGRLPAEYALVGIQPESIDWGSEPSSVVGEAVDRAVELIEAMLVEKSP
jgi:hydrogenase maturation protease